MDQIIFKLMTHVEIVRKWGQIYFYHRRRQGVMGCGGVGAGSGGGTGGWKNDRERVKFKGVPRFGRGAFQFAQKAPHGRIIDYADIYTRKLD